MSDRNTKLQQIFIKKQADVNTFAFEAADPADSTDLLLAYDIGLPAPGGEELTRNGQSATHTPMPGRPGSRTLPATFSTDLIVHAACAGLDTLFKTTTGTPMQSLLEACDLTVTPTGPSPAITKIVLTPNTNSSRLISMFHSLDGLSYQGLDAKAGFKLILTAGQIAKFVWSPNGKWDDVDSDFSAVPIVSTFQDAYVVQSVNTITLTIDPDGTPAAKTIDVINMELDWSPVIVIRQGQKGTFGQKDPITVSREPTITIDPEMGVDATDTAIIDAWEAKTPVKFEWKSGSAAPYFSITAYGEIVKPGVKDASGEARHDIVIRLCKETTAAVSGDSELEITWESVAPDPE